MVGVAMGVTTRAAGGAPLGPPICALLACVFVKDLLCPSVREALRDLRAHGRRAALLSRAPRLA